MRLLSTVLLIDTTVIDTHLHFYIHKTQKQNKTNKLVVSVPVVIKTKRKERHLSLLERPKVFVRGRVTVSRVGEYGDGGYGRA